MSKEELIDYLKNNLKIHIDSDRGGSNYGYDSASIEVSLSLAGERFYSESVYI